MQIKPRVPEAIIPSNKEPLAKLIRPRHISTPGYE